MSFQDWWTNNNNPSLPKSEYLYGTRHIIVLCLVVIACIVFSLLFYKKSERAKWILLKVFASILLFFEVVSRIVNLIIAENYTLETVTKILLPMHICSVMVWVFIIAIFSKCEMLLSFGTIGGLLTTVAYLLFPAVGLNKVYISFSCFYSVFSHSLGFVTAVLMITLGVAKFEFKKIWQPFVCFAVMFAWGAILNWLIFPGSDYMYMRNDPLELGLPFPYQILYVVAIAIYIFLFYFITWLVKKIKYRKS